MEKITITLIRQGNEAEDMCIAVAVLDSRLGELLEDPQASEGILRDDDGLLAVWEIA